MDKLKMQTPNITDKNIAQIAKLFPNVITEIKDDAGNSKKAVDFDLLKQNLSDVLVDDENERYRLDWPGKKASLLKANTPIIKTLRPCREESVDFDTTENVYIEGDNFEVLKILQESYLGKIKMIYIDPPYNTGGDFIYKDNFKVTKEEYEDELGAVADDGDKLFKNTDSNGRFHSDWLSMMYERLVVARDLLREDGVIFISIGENELCNLEKICNEIFGEENSVAIIPRLMKSGGNKGRFFSPNIDYILVYARNISEIDNFKSELDPKLVNRLYNKIETVGDRKGERYRPFGLYQSSLDARPNQRYYIECPDGSLAIPPGNTMPEIEKDGCKILPSKSDGCWRWSRDRYLKEKSRGNIVFIESKSGVLITPKGSASGWNVYTKIWLKDRQEEGQTPTNFISKFENRHSAKELTDLNIPFDFAKPSGLIKYLITLVKNTKKDIILDFFSGSSTTAQAAMHLNAEDKFNRKFIMVQLDEKTDKKSEAYKAGYKTIAEIGKERIRRAGKKIKEENKDKEEIENLDIGFRVYKTATTNMKPVYYHPEKLGQKNLFDLISNIKEDRTPDDLLTQVILDLGLELNLPIEKKDILGNTVFVVQTNALVACFDDNINFKIVDKIAELSPFKVVFKDSSFSDDKDRINVEERFKRLSPETVITVI